MTDTMPTDVRATITALFPERVAEEQQRERRAAGQVGTAALLESIGAVDAELRRYAERLLAGGPDDAPTDAIAAVAELRDAILALRLLNARREMARLSAVMADEPDAPAMGRWRERFAELTAYVRDLERSGKVRPRPWAALLEREKRPPAEERQRTETMALSKRLKTARDASRAGETR